MKIFKFITWICSFILIGSYTSCSSGKQIEAADAQELSQNKPLENALLWKVTGNGITKPSYVYGTIHIINKEDFFLPEGTLSAVESTDKMIFEINMNDMNDMSKQMGMLKEVFMNDNTTLKDLLTEEEYGVVETHFKGMGLPMMMFERMKPMFLTVFAGDGMDIGGLQSGSMKSYEMEFFEMAQNTSTPVGGLETIEYQLSMFDSIPYKDQAMMLVETIQTSDAGSDIFKEMIDMYKSQNITSMVQMMDAESMGGHEDLLIFQRNRNWIPIMEDLMKEGPVFFAVGAGHLAGTEGVLKLLMKQGYKVVPISHEAKT